MPPTDADLEREYSPSTVLPDGVGMQFVEAFFTASTALREATDGWIELPDGSLLRPGLANKPMLVFIHGGYWQAFGAADFIGVGAGAVAAGWSFASLQYTLAPQQTLAAMVPQCAAALAHAAGAVQSSRLVLAGHSSGAQLAAMVALCAEPPVAVDKLVLISGLYDLRDLPRLAVNDTLGLDAASAAAASPQLLARRAHHDVVVAWGEIETTPFRQQGRDFAAALVADGSTAAAIEYAGRNHFDVCDEMLDPAGALLS